ncbi:MAG: acyl-CoA dehydrogenase family protein [Janthinobacterium lividum]
MDGLTSRADPLHGMIAAVAANAARHDREGSFPADSLALLHTQGLLALTVPRAQGGEGAGLARLVSVVGRVAEGCASTALILSMQLLHQHALARSANWAPGLKATVAEGAVTSGALINALRVEPALGTPARGGLPDTVARRTAQGWSISGRKIYSTGAPGLSWMLVWVGTDEPEPRTGMILVPAHAPGVRIEPTWDHLGLRGSGSHDVVFEGVVVPYDNVGDLRVPAAWGRPDREQVAGSTRAVASLYTGVARAARDWLARFLVERVPSNLGAPLSTLPRMQEAVGAIQALLLVNERLIAGAAAEYDAGGGPTATEFGLIKAVASENAILAVQQAVALAGNHALARANPLERHLRDVLCARIHTPQADVTHTVAGRAALAA